MEAIKLCRLDTPIIFIEARINLSRFVVTGCAAKTSATVTFRSEERFSRNAETDLVCRLLLEKKKDTIAGFASVANAVDAMYALYIESLDRHDARVAPI